MSVSTEEVFASPPAESVPLDDRLDEAAREERQRALCALLQHPLLTAQGPHAVEFGLVRRHVHELREWLSHQVNWTLVVTSEFARVRKTPADSTDESRPARDLRTDAPFTRSRYILLCLALAVLERSERQTTLGRLAEGMVGFFVAEPRLAAAGYSFDLHSMDQRRDLVQAIRFLGERQVLSPRHGDEDQFIKDERNDVLYNVNRPVLAAMLSVRRGPSMVTAEAFEQRLAAILEEPMPDTEDGRNREIRVRLMRRLLDDPVLYYEDLSVAERSYLDSQRGAILRRIRDATDLVPEIRAEGIALLDLRGNMSDLGLPEEGTDGHLALLTAEFLANRLRQDSATVVGFSALCAHTAELIAEHRHWRKDVRLPGADRVLTETTIGRLEALRLLRRLDGAVKPLPAIARYALAISAKEESETGELF